jgi:hydroxymethylpyrimidine kinase/phosphomethylpyrimidine kinase
MDVEQGEHKMKPTLLSIAGFDPSGGAGILVDLKVFRDLGFHGAAAPTALTVQTTRTVERVESVRPASFVRQIEALDGDLAVAGIKVGMAATEANLYAVGRFIAAHPDIPRVIDPVFRSSSGKPLLDPKGRAAFVPALRGRATVLTPNIDEAGFLAGLRVSTVEDMAFAARVIAGELRFACLVKGGHLEGEAVNVLFDGTKTFLYGRPRLKKDVHGTGCIFSAALLAYLSKGKDLPTAAARAADFTHAAIAKAVRAGRGRPVYS